MVAFLSFLFFSFFFSPYSSIEPGRPVAPATRQAGGESKCAFVPPSASLYHLSYILSARNQFRCQGAVQQSAAKWFVWEHEKKKQYCDLWPRDEGDVPKQKKNTELVHHGKRFCLGKRNSCDFSSCKIRGISKPRAHSFWKTGIFGLSQRSIWHICVCTDDVTARAKNCKCWFYHQLLSFWNFHNKLVKLQRADKHTDRQFVGQSAHLTFVRRLRRLLCDLQLPTAPHSECTYRDSSSYCYHSSCTLLI